MWICLATCLSPRLTSRTARSMTTKVPYMPGSFRSATTLSPHSKIPISLRPEATRQSTCSKTACMPATSRSGKVWYMLSRPVYFCAIFPTSTLQVLLARRLSTLPTKPSPSGAPATCSMAHGSAMSPATTSMVEQMSRTAPGASPTQS